MLKVNDKINKKIGYTKEQAIFCNENNLKIVDSGSFYVVESAEVELTNSEKRVLKYGSIESQIEFITENGLLAWQEKVETIKKELPIS